MTKNLGKADQIILIVIQEFVGHRMAEQVGMNLQANDCRILVAQSSNTTVAQRSTFTDEDVLAFGWRTGIKIRLQSTSGGQRQWH